jgi:hypothetical protein
VKIIVYNELLSGVSHLRVTPAVDSSPFFLISKYYWTVNLRKTHKAAKKTEARYKVAVYRRNTRKQNRHHQTSKTVKRHPTTKLAKQPILPSAIGTKNNTVANSKEASHSTEHNKNHTQDRADSNSTGAWQKQPQPLSNTTQTWQKPEAAAQTSSHQASNPIPTPYLPP